LKLNDKIAVVTGGSRGIGRATVECLAALGANVVVNYVSDESAANEAVVVAEARGVGALAVKADIWQLGEAHQLIETTMERFGRVDYLICNAGIWEGTAVDQLTEELWDRTIDLNLKGTWTVCHAAVPHMKKQGSGRIVIVSSTAGQRGEANVSNYAASKGGQISLTKFLAAELGPVGINVNSVALGWVDTDMGAEVFAQPGFRQSFAESIPVG